MGAFFRQLRKSELHVHLEGSLRPATLCRIAAGITEHEVEDRYRYWDFAGFIDTYKWVVQQMSEPEHYAIAARALLAELEAHNVRHAEINLSAGVIEWKQQSLAAIYDAVAAETRASSLDVVWIFDAVRQFGPQAAMRVAELAAERRTGGVIAFGLGGDESRYPSSEFKDVFKFARNSGLHISTHAGETTDSTSIWGAIELGAERIGHGIRAAGDTSLMRHLRDNDIPLEICISSNVATGAVPSLEAHPVRQLYEAGVPIVLNTDDPAMFGTDISREYEIAAEVFRFSHKEIEGLAEAGFRYAFRP